MSAAAIGAYIRLLCFQWEVGHVPTDDRAICRITGMFQEEWNEVRNDVLAKFEHDESGNLVNARLAKEKVEREGIRNKRIDAALVGAGRKWGNEPETPSKMASKIPSNSATKRSERLTAARMIATHTKEEWLEMAAHFGGCVRCGADEGGEGVEIVKDHITPIYQGGSDGIANLQPLCRTCNCAKGREAIDHRDSGKRPAKCLAKWLASTSTTTSSSLSSTTAPKTSRKSPPVAPLPFSSPEFAEAWAKWEKHRKEKKALITDTTREMQLKRLAQLGESRAIAALSYSIMHGWTGIFEENGGITNKSKPDPGPCPFEKKAAELRELLKTPKTAEENLADFNAIFNGGIKP